MFAKLISVLSGWVWGPPMLILQVGTGLFLTIRLKGLQFRSLPLAFHPSAFRKERKKSARCRRLISEP